MRALVVDDHPLIQEAVSGVLRRLDAAAELAVASDCERAFELAARGVEPDVVLLDLNLPGLSGIGAVKAWRARFPAVPVIVLSAAADQQTVLAALGAGAAGFIPKSSSSEVMASAVRLVLAGGKYVPSEALTRLGAAESAPKMPRNASTLGALGLTERQIEVLRLLASGASNKVIGRELNLAERTVKAHVTALFRVLNVSNRTQAALAATRLGVGGAGKAEPVSPK